MPRNLSTTIATFSGRDELNEATSWQSEQTDTYRLVLQLSGNFLNRPLGTGDGQALYGFMLTLDTSDPVSVGN